MHKQYSRQSLSFIYGVAPLPIGLDNTSTKSHRNASMAPLSLSLDITPMELIASSLCVGSLSLLSYY